MTRASRVYYMEMDLARLRRRLTHDHRLDDLAAFDARLHAIGQAEAGLTRMSDADLRREAASLRQRAESGLPVEAVTVAGFALVREVARRVLGQRLFDVQILGGLALFDGHITEMQTGEGKTLCAVAPASVHALLQRSVHILTFNDYLARRDAEWMGDIYPFLGLRVGFVQEGMDFEVRRLAYAADVTYATAKEAGFDFLRDGLALDESEFVHRRLEVAIVDEADSILIDEARIPLVIAGSTESDRGSPERLAHLVTRLEAGSHYEVDVERRTVHLTDDGIDRTEELLGGLRLHDEANLQYLVELNAALYAAALMRRDVDYIVRGGGVEIVDEFTGRVVEDRHWPDGLQAAIETKEGVNRSTEGRILGQISLQHYMSQYDHLCGMTATASTAEQEFLDVYGLTTKVVPANRPCVRIDHDDAVFSHAEAKLEALTDEICAVQATSRPILVGTRSVAESESLAEHVRHAGVSCSVLNAKRDAAEARLVADAGRSGAVTISTNMAGRGTDIRLGGADESERDAVVALGGLLVIGTSRHESRRIDDQLRGRAGRQGDPGASRFFVSLDDELMETHRLQELIPKRHWPASQSHPVEDPRVLHEVARIQRIAEGWSFDVRHALVQYSQVLEQQRHAVYEYRRSVLTGDTEPHTRLPHLLAIDVVWADHLAEIAEVREGIHLVGVGGMSPTQEFARQVIAAFADFYERVGKLHDEQLSSDHSLRGPSATWSYLVDDDIFENRVAAALVSNRDIGFSAGAALMGPLLALWAIIRRRQRRR